MQLVRTRPWTLAALATVACSGAIGPSAGGGSGREPGAAPRAGNGSAVGGAGGSTPRRPDDPASTAPAPSSLVDKLPDTSAVVLRRLSRVEYNAAVHDLLGDTTAPANAFVPDAAVFGFENNAETLTVSPALGGGYFDAAEALAADAVTKRLAQLAPCSGQQERACGQHFVTSFGRKAWRRPLTDDEAARLMTVYDLGAKRRGYAGGVQLVIQALLFSPSFAFRIEVGEPVPGRADVLRPTSYEMATRLSFALWGTTPDDALLDLAGTGALTSSTEIRKQAERMLDDPRAAGSLAAFTDQWLGLQQLATLDKDAKIFPAWNASLGPLFADEVRRFTGDVVASGAPLAKLFASSTTFANATLAGYYGLSGASSADLVAVDGGAHRRAGLLTTGGFLAAHAHRDQTSPTKRGKFVREQLFCSPLAPPPPGVNNAVPPINATDTTRQRLEKHRASPSCASCHALMDPIGLAFEHYDGAGLWRDRENGDPIDATGELVGLDVTGKFDGVDELTQKVTASDEVAQCFARQWFRAAMGRDAAVADAEALVGLAARGKASVKDLIASFTQTDAFLFRPAPQP